MYSFEVQAVILAAGRGSRMSQLVGSSGSSSSSVPKCLIPLAGNPLIYYSLLYLAKSGFQQPGKDILIIIQDREDIRKAVEKISDRLKLSSCVEIFCVAEGSDEFGTCESLRLAYNASKIKQNDVLLMSCDAITDVPLVRLLNFHQSRDADFTCLFSKNLEAPSGKLPGPKIKIKQEKDIVGVDPSNSQLVFLANEADFEDDLVIPTQTMKKIPHIKLYTWLQDAHIYLLKRSILADYLLKSTKTNIKGEFIPQLIREQIEKSSLNIFAFIQPENKTVRVNSTSTFSTANKSSFWIKSLYGSQAPSSSTPEIHESDSFEKGKVKIPASSKVQSSTIGSHVVLGEKCKILNTIILDHVDIGDGCILENCIISSNSKIGENSTLKEVLVGPNYHVHSGSRYQNETLSAMEETLFEV